MEIRAKADIFLGRKRPAALHLNKTNIQPENCMYLPPAIQVNNNSTLTLAS